MTSPDERFDDSIITITCPHCGTRIRGTETDIDSGMRKHMEYCTELELGEAVNGISQ